MRCLLFLPQLTLVQRRLSYWVGWAKRYGIHFRLEETNTLAISGLAGASNVLGAALYYVDFALTMIQTGVSGINFHDSNCSPYSPILLPSVGGQGAVVCPADEPRQAPPSVTLSSLSTSDSSLDLVLIDLFLLSAVPPRYDQACLSGMQLGSSAMCPDTCGNASSVPYLSAPFYGMVFTQMALAGLPLLLQVAGLRRGMNL